MGTTTKMAIPYPEATGLVKDGWEDMKDIATQVDAKSGLVLLNTTSFSAVSSQAIDNIFSSNYRDYRIVMDFNCSTAIALTSRLRTGSGDDTAANYQRQYIFASSTSITSARVTNLSYWDIGTFGNSTNVIIADIFSPNVAQNTTAYYNCPYNSGSTAIEIVQNAFGKQTTVQYTGISFICNTGNITGSVSVYGYNK